MKKIWVLTAFIACAAGTALADSPSKDQGPDGGEIFKSWDANGDGVVTRDEAQAKSAEHISRMFDKFDTDKDGRLTREELRAAHGEHMAAMKERFDERFKAADKNSDGKISKGEAQAGMPMMSKHFDQIDTNKDGQVTQDELRAHHMQMRGEMHSRGADGRHRSESGGQAGQ